MIKYLEFLRKIFLKGFKIYQNYLCALNTVPSKKKKKKKKKKIRFAWSYTPSEDLMRHKNEHVKKSSFKIII